MGRPICRFDFTFSNIYLFPWQNGKISQLSSYKSLSPAIIDKFGRIEYHYFENENFKNIMSRMTANPQQIIHNTFFSVISCINSTLKLIGMLGVFFNASPWIGLGAFVIGLPMTIMELRSTDKQQNLRRETTPDKRKEIYIRSLFINKNAVYEMKLFGAKKLYAYSLEDCAKQNYS